VLRHFVKKKKKIIKYFVSLTSEDMAEKLIFNAYVETKFFVSNFVSRCLITLWFRDPTKNAGELIFKA
jgi:hypothetical protein